MKASRFLLFLLISFFSKRNRRTKGDVGAYTVLSIE